MDFKQFIDKLQLSDGGAGDLIKKIVESGGFRPKETKPQQAGVLDLVFFLVGVVNSFLTSVKIEVTDDELEKRLTTLAELLFKKNQELSPRLKEVKNEQLVKWSVDMWNSTSAFENCPREWSLEKARKVVNETIGPINTTQEIIKIFYFLYK